MLRQHFSTLPNAAEMIRQRIERVPLERLLEPDNVGRAIVYLASEESSGITGTAQLVDGGILAGCEYNAGWGR